MWRYSVENAHFSWVILCYHSTQSNYLDDMYFFYSYNENIFVIFFVFFETRDKWKLFVSCIESVLKEASKLTDAWMSGLCLFLRSPASLCFGTIALYRPKNLHSFFLAVTLYFFGLGLLFSLSNNNALFTLNLILTSSFIWKWGHSSAEELGELSILRFSEAAREQLYQFCYLVQWTIIIFEKLRCLKSSPASNPDELLTVWCSK